MSNQTHRTCIRMSAAEYQQLMKKSKSAGMSANAWLKYGQSHAELDVQHPYNWSDSAIANLLENEVYLATLST